MSARPSFGVIQICVQCDFASQQSSIAAHHHLIDLSAELSAILQRHRIPATWALADQNLEALHKVVSSDDDLFETALVAQSSWCNAALPRTRVVNELHRQLDLFRNQDLDVSTLVLRNTSLGDHIEVLKRAGIQVVRRRVDQPFDHQLRSTMSPRFGVLQVSPTATLPGKPGFLVRWDQTYSAKKSLWKAISQRSTEHIVIDLAGLPANQVPDCNVSNDGYERSPGSKMPGGYRSTSVATPFAGAAQSPKITHRGRSCGQRPKRTATCEGRGCTCKNLETISGLSRYSS